LEAVRRENLTSNLEVDFFLTESWDGNNSNVQLEGKKEKGKKIMEVA